MARSQSGVRKAGGTVLSFEEWEALVRGWKGAASSVLWVLMARAHTAHGAYPSNRAHTAHGAYPSNRAHTSNGAHSVNGMTAVELEWATGYSDKPVRQALAKLEALGLVEHHGRARGWRMSRRARAELLRWLVTPNGRKRDK